MTKKRDGALTKSEALVAAWKLRDTYKGYDRRRGSSYNSWRPSYYRNKKEQK